MRGGTATFLPRRASTRDARASAAARVRALEEALKATRAQKAMTQYEVGRVSTRQQEFPTKRFELPRDDDIVVNRPPPARAPKCYPVREPLQKAPPLLQRVSQPAPSPRRAKAKSDTLTRAGALAMSLSSIIFSDNELNANATAEEPVSAEKAAAVGPTDAAAAPASAQAAHTAGGDALDVAIMETAASASLTAAMKPRLHPTADMLAEITARNEALAAHVARIEHATDAMLRARAAPIKLPTPEVKLTDQERVLTLERDQMARRARARDTAKVHCTACGMEVLYRKRKHHMAHECEYRLVVCQTTGCGRPLRHRDMEFHHSARCGVCDSCGVENCGAGEEHDCVYRSTHQIETAVVVVDAPPSSPTAAAGEDGERERESRSRSPTGVAGSSRSPRSLSPARIAARAKAKAQLVIDEKVEATAPAAKMLADLSEMVEKHPKMRGQIIARTERENPDLAAHSVIRKVLFLDDQGMYSALDEEGWKDMASSLHHIAKEWSVRAEVSSRNNGAKTSIVMRLLSLCEDCFTGGQLPPGTEAIDFESVVLCSCALKRQALAERGMELRNVLHDCPHGCGVQLPLAKLRRHEKTRCRLRPVPCKHHAQGCFKLIRWKDRAQHYAVECMIEKELGEMVKKGRRNREHVECQLGCGLILPRSARGMHEEHSCPNRLAPCRKGCGSFFMLHQLDEHHAQCTPPKMAKMIRKARAKYVRPWAVAGGRRSDEEEEYEDDDDDDDDDDEEEEEE